MNWRKGWKVESESDKAVKKAIFLLSVQYEAEQIIKQRVEAAILFQLATRQDLQEVRPSFLSNL